MKCDWGYGVYNDIWHDLKNGYKDFMRNRYLPAHHYPRVIVSEVVKR